MSAGRIPLLDALRGFALFGILQINLQGWIVGLSPFSLLLEGNGATVDHFIWLLISFFITAKFYPIFGFLFGYSFSLQWGRMADRDIDPRPLFKRRYAFLLLLGFAHGVLLFFGDILTLYAVAGFVLLRSAGLALPMLRKHLQVWLVAALVVIGILTLNVLQLVSTSGPDALIAAPIHGFAGRAWAYLSIQPTQIALFLPQVMVFFLCGAYAARIGLLQHPGSHQKRWSQLAKLGIFVGMPVSAVFTGLKWLAVAHGIDGPWLAASATLANYLCALMSPAIVAAFVVLGMRLRRGSWLTPAYRAMADAGRMALSNYIAQSLLMLLLLEVAGLRHHLSIASLALLGLVIYVLQCWASAWILRHYRSGPLEWLWRRFTYRTAFLPG